MICKQRGWCYIQCLSERMQSRDRRRCFSALIFENHGVIPQSHLRREFTERKSRHLTRVSKSAPDALGVLCRIGKRE